MKISEITITIALAGFSTVSFAHKSKDTHSHCVVDGKGVKVSGKTDAARKKACGKIAGSSWDEQNPKPIEAIPSATETGHGAPAAPAAEEHK